MNCACAQGSGFRVQAQQQENLNLNLGMSQEGFTVGLPETETETETQYEEGTTVYATPPSSSFAGSGTTESEAIKRKRGRPRKYGPHAAVAFSPTTASPTKGRGRGRPRGSAIKPRFRPQPQGRAGVSIIPHVITVKAGEDLAAKILSVSLNVAKNVCILTANGCISNVTLHQPDTSGGTVTYEGRFEILTLGGSLLLAGNGSQHHRYGGLNISLSGPDGRVLGGGVAGLLVAASPVQIILGCFAEEESNESNLANRVENLSAPPNVTTAGQSTFSESSGGPGSPLNHGTGTCNNNNAPQSISGMPWK